MVNKTSIFSWRLIYKTFHGIYNNNYINIDDTHESPLVVLIPVVLLSIGAIFAGYTFKDLFIGHNGYNNFWQDSILFLEPLSTDHPPLWFLVLTPILVILSIPIAYYLFVKNKEFSPSELEKILRDKKQLGDDAEKLIFKKEQK